MKRTKIVFPTRVSRISWHYCVERVVLFLHILHIIILYANVSAVQSTKITIKNVILIGLQLTHQRKKQLCVNYV